MHWFRHGRDNHGLHKSDKSLNAKDAEAARWYAAGIAEERRGRLRPGKRRGCHKGDGGVYHGDRRRKAEEAETGGKQQLRTNPDLRFPLRPSVFVLRTSP